MRPHEVKDSLRLLVSVQQPAFLWGPPGVGKSDVVNQLAAEDGKEVRDFRLALRDPTDLKGYGFADHANDCMKFLRDEELPREGNGILFFDEMNSAPAAMQAAAMQLTLTRRIGSYKLPVGWDIIAAGNRETDRGVTSRMPSPLANRFIHLDYDVSLDDWCAWAFANNITSNTISFMRTFPKRLHEFDPSQKAFPTPRSWAFTDKLVAKGIPAGIELALISGAVGEGAAGEYLAFVKSIRDMPNIDKIMLDPNSVATPPEGRTDIMFAVCTSLIQRTQKNVFDRIMKYVSRLPTEFQVVYVKDAVRKDDECCETPAFQEWIVKNADVMS